MCVCVLGYVFIQLDDSTTNYNFLVCFHNFVQHCYPTINKLNVNLKSVFAPKNLANCSYSEVAFRSQEGFYVVRHLILPIKYQNKLHPFLKIYIFNTQKNKLKIEGRQNKL